MPTPGPETSIDGPVRTCIGCRRRAAAAVLLRVVATVVVAPDATGRPGGTDLHDPQERPAGAVPVVPDPRRRRPGRGAWVHPDPDCVASALRRRAFGRALRVPGPIDSSAVEEYVSPGGAARHPEAPASGFPQEMKINGNSMKRQR